METRTAEQREVQMVDMMAALWVDWKAYRTVQRMVAQKDHQWVSWMVEKTALQMAVLKDR